LPAPILVPGEGAMKDDTGEIFTLDEVAVYLKAGKRTVYRLAATKKISAFKVGGTWRFSRQEIDQWIKRQANDDTSGDDRRGNE
jgi:excisionase family DNA binding protein